MRIARLQLLLHDPQLFQDIDLHFLPLLLSQLRNPPSQIPQRRRLALPRLRILRQSLPHPCFGIIGTVEDLDKLEEELFAEGLGDLVEALRNANRQREAEEFLKQQLAGKSQDEL